MKTRTTILLAISLVVVLVAVLVARPASTASSLGPPQIQFVGYATNSASTVLASFACSNTNAGAIAFRVFGPQSKGEDGRWPGVASGTGMPPRRLKAGGRTSFEVVAPVGVPAWRLIVAFDRGLGPWERLGLQMRVLESRLGLPQFPAPPTDNGAEPMHTIVEMPPGPGWTLPR